MLKYDLLSSALQDFVNMPAVTSKGRCLKPMGLAVIDADRLTDLKREIGEDDFSEVVEVFLDEMDELLAEIRQAGPTATEADYHKLRGGASNLGFQALAQTCREIELNLAECAASAPDRIDALYKQSLQTAALAFPDDFQPVLRS